MKKIFMSLFILLSFNVNSQKVINIQPLGDVSPDVIFNIKTSIENFYSFKCNIRTKVNFSNDILTKSKTRYDASKIINKFNGKEIVLVITEKDIATRKGDIPEWGVFGLGYLPGVTSVISTFRLKRNVSKNKFLDRLEKVILHEIGHNLGLPHCKSGDKRCMMNDANGTIKEVDDEQIFLCDKCKKIINFIKPSIK